MSTGSIVLAWIGIVLLLIVAVAVLSLLERLMRPVHEVERYSRHVLDAVEAIARNLEGVGELRRTRDLATALPGPALAYLERAGLA